MISLIFHQHTRNSPSLTQHPPHLHHTRRDTSTSASTTFTSGRKTPHLLISPSSLRRPYTSSELKSSPVSSVDVHAYDAVDSYFSIDVAHKSLRSLLGYSFDDQLPSPMPRSNGHGHEHSHATVPERTERDHSASPPRPISRSSSQDSLSTAPSSEAPATPKSHSPLLPEFRPTLADLEQASRFRVHAVCTTCRKTGSNFPSCSRCGETWCSRNCRLKGSSGARHTCRGRPIDSQRLSASSHAIPHIS